MAGVDLDLVRHAIRVARLRGYAEVELQTDGWEFHAQLEPGAKLPPPPIKEEPTPKGGEPAVRAPYVGYFKDSGTPLRPGQNIKTGDVVGAILALGIPNDVEADAAGEIEEVLVKDGDPVEFGQPLVTFRRTQ